MRVLVTGGAGYIGSHTIVELLAAGYDVTSVDDFSNSDPSVNGRIEKIAGKPFEFIRMDVTDRAALSAVFAKNKIDCVIHFAAYKAVAESVAQPLKYYRNNLDSLLTLCDITQQYECDKIIFSSSATVYGTAAKVPVVEDSPLSAINPYGQTKLMAEQILRDVARARPGLCVTLLRYFNPIGAHKSGIIGELPHNIPNNVLPRIAQVAIGKLPVMPITGDDYPTPDGTGVRDYIHVVDLAKGHVAAIAEMDKRKGVEAFNLGTGKGSSVFEMLHAMEKACGHAIPYEISPRRPGDSAVSYCDTSKAERVLGWKAQYTIEQACADAWRWQQYVKANNL